MELKFQKIKTRVNVNVIRELASVVIYLVD